MPDLAPIEYAPPVARLFLNRPEKRNALSLDLLTALRARVGELALRSDISVVVLSGMGPTFCAGMDLKAVLSEPGAPLRLLESIAELTIAIRALPQVVVAKVHGAAIGGGCGLVAVSDIALTHPDAKLGYPEVDLGVCPAVVAPWLVASVGAGVARRILLQGGTMSGLRALEFGLVAEAVPKESLDARVEEIVATLAKAGPRALAATKAHLNAIAGAAVHAQVRKGAAISAEVIAGPEARARLGAVYGG
jgi:enoyl-CoA hydratase/carnithine racemase